MHTYIREPDGKVLAIRATRKEVKQLFINNGVITPPVFVKSSTALRKARFYGKVPTMRIYDNGTKLGYL